MNNEFAKIIRTAYPNIDWPRFDEADRALNYELIVGPLPKGYWKDTEPLTHYEWNGFVRVRDDITEMLSDLPHTVLIDMDCDQLIDDADDFSDYVSEIETRRVVMHNETYNILFG